MVTVPLFPEINGFVPKTINSLYYVPCSPILSFFPIPLFFLHLLPFSPEIMPFSHVPSKPLGGHEEKTVRGICE